MRTPPLLLAALSLAAAVSSAAAQPVIDDFETGTFHLVGTAGTYVSGVSSVSAPAHGMAAFREIGVLSYAVGGLPAKADIDAWTVADDVLRITLPPGGGKALLTCTPASPVDLTAGGLNDRIEVGLAASTTGASLQIEIDDDLGGSGGALIIPTAGANVFAFANLGGSVNLARVTRIQIELDGNTGAWDVRDIRAMRSDAIWLKYDAPLQPVAGPPFPVDPLIFTVTDKVPSDHQNLRLLSAMKTATGSDAPIALTGMDSGGDTGSGLVGGVRAAWNDPGQPFERTAFDMKVDVSALSGIEPQPFIPALPAVTPTPTGFLLAFEVFFLGDMGQVVRTSMRRMAFDMLPGQALQFDDVRVSPIEPALSAAPGFGANGAATTAGFRLTFDAVAAGGVDVAEPLFEVTLTGDCAAAQTTGVPGSVAAGPQTLRARPTITRAGTELRLARPAEAAGAIDVYDASGRRVRRMALRPGDSGRFWDGRDERGRPGAAGLYFARYLDGAHGCTARVVRLP
jgi:hypothetical protein